MNLREKLENAKFNLNDEVEYAIEVLKLETLRRINISNLAGLIESNGPASGGCINMSEIVKDTGLNQNLVKMIDILTNKLNFYKSLSCLLDKKLQVALKILDDLA